MNKCTYTTPIPFQSIVALAMSSPNFFGDIPKGPIRGAKTAGGAGSPPVTRIIIVVTCPAPGGPGMMSFAESLCLSNLIASQAANDENVVDDKVAGTVE